MRLLVFDTSFSACSVALIDTGARKPDDTHDQDQSKTLAACYEPMQTGQAIHLLPMVSKVMNQAQLTFDELGAIATSFGPGTFTGVRIAVATARALALSTGLPIYGFSSLALLAAKAEHTLYTAINGQLIAATMDARREELYVQFFSDATKPPLSKPQLLNPTAAVKIFNKPVVAVGTGAVIFHQAAISLARPVELQLEDLQPDATYSKSVYMERLNPFSPLYLRPPDAKPQVGKTIPRES